MHIKKRRKRSRARGSYTHFRGGKKKARGSGHRGGFGMAGTGKRADQRKTYVLNLYGSGYFSKRTALRRKIKPKISSINLNSIQKNIFSLIKKGIAKESKGVLEINLSEYKILSKGNFNLKVKITAHSASKTAIEQVKKAGGSLHVLDNKKETE